MQISELKPKQYGIEIYATILNIQPIRKLWKCFSCGNKGIWLEEKEFMVICPKCNAPQSVYKRKGLWIQNVTTALVQDESGKVFLDIWKSDIEKLKVGDNVHIINGFTKDVEHQIHIARGKYGIIEVLK